MNIATARALVTEDQRQSYPTMTEDEAIDHARNTLSVEEIYEPESDLGQAYLLVLGEYV